MRRTAKLFRRFFIFFHNFFLFREKAAKKAVSQAIYSRYIFFTIGKYRDKSSGDRRRIKKAGALYGSSFCETANILHKLQTYNNLRRPTDQDTKKRFKGTYTVRNYTLNHIAIASVFLYFSKFSIIL